MAGGCRPGVNYHNGSCSMSEADARAWRSARGKLKTT